MSGYDKSKLPSRHATEGPERAPHRAFYYAMGLTEKEIHQPFVGGGATWIAGIAFPDSDSVM